VAEFDKLTDDEYTRLAQLGTELERIREISQTQKDVYWTFVNELGGGFISPDGVHSQALRERRHSDVRIEANELHIKRWEQAGYISVVPSGLTQFLLTPHGADYLVYRARPGIVRWFVDHWQRVTRALMALLSCLVAIVRGCQGLS
jgi:hypothetical protein